MKYVNAATVLPEKLIKELQQYVQGEAIYIPKLKKNYQQWGTLSGGRQAIDDRNRSIKKAYKEDGASISELSEEYFLSIETIKKIIYSK
ncbi:CD3324 family protein [Bacillus spongiae]|uniref:CD3324 family protein n=1 Tax=Bacillus spongiae TaxID=2683610 RepID=A0ABU8HGC9_9BACI